MLSPSPGTPRTDHLRERWLFYIIGWLAIIEFPIVFVDAIAEMFHPHNNWARIGLSLAQMLLDLIIAAASVWLTRGILPVQVMGNVNDPPTDNTPLCSMSGEPTPATL